MSVTYQPDWSALLNRLRSRANLSLARIGRQLDPMMDEATINRLARGEIREPRFSQAMQLLDLAADNFAATDWHDVRR